MSISTAFFKDFIFILFFRERGKEGQGEGEEHQCARETSFGCLSHAPNRGPGPQPRHVPWLGIELVKFWFASQHSIHWATPARAEHACSLKQVSWKSQPDMYRKYNLGVKIVSNLYIIPVLLKSILFILISLYLGLKRYTRGDAKKPRNLFIKNCAFILTCLNFSHLQSTLHLMQNTYWDIFFHYSKQFFPLLKIVDFVAI